MLDYIASVIVFGVLILTVGRVQTNLNSTMYQNTYTLTTQRNAVDLARQIESDFLKIGHRVRGAKISYADTSRITFRGDLMNDWDTVVVDYLAGAKTQSSQTANPNDFPLFRTVKGVSITQQWGLTRFYLQYLDSVNRLISTPITVSDSLRRIRSIDVQFTVESPSGVITTTDTLWAGVNWRKLIFPRNLNKIDY